MCPRPFCCASHCGCSSPVQPKPLEISKNIQKLTKQTCQPHLSKVLSIFKGPGKGSTHVFDTRILHLSAFTSLASVFPRIHRISVQPSQETLKDHHAVCKIYHLMLLMDKILQTNWQLILTDIGEAPMNHSHPKWFTPDFPASSVSSKFAAECLVTNQSLQLQLRPQVAMKLQLRLRLLKKLVHRASVARRFAVSSLSAVFFPKVWRC